MSQALNPRFVLWTLTRAEPIETFGRDADGDLVRIPHHVDGSMCLWTIVFMQWVRGQWAEWEASLGFKPGLVAGEAARLAGHPEAEFDAWLDHKVRSLHPERHEWSGR